MSEPQPIERAFFREAEDGTPVFFPWGLTHRGYRITSAADRKRATRATSLLMGGILGVSAWAAQQLQRATRGDEAAGAADVLHGLVAPGIALGLVLLAYFAWSSRFVERLPESALQVSRDERLREAAALVAPWKLALCGVTVCALSALLIWLEPLVWWLGLLGLATGIGLIVWSRVLHQVATAPAVVEPPRPGRIG